MFTCKDACRSRLLTVVFPAALLAVTLLAERVFGYWCFSACEDGPLENIQVIICAIGAVAGLCLLMAPRTAYPLAARGLFLFGVIACIYIALEEISYGQRIFGWQTPEAWSIVNDQDEINLHNTSSWLDQKPRLLLEIGVYVGGIIMPLISRFKPALLPQKFSAIYPDPRLMVIALFALGARLLREVSGMMHVPETFIINRSSELQEAYLYGFIMLYFVFMNSRYRSAQP